MPGFPGYFRLPETHSIHSHTNSLFTIGHRATLDANPLKVPNLVRLRYVSVPFYGFLTET